MGAKMSGKVEYKVGEIFRFYDETFQCVPDSAEGWNCDLCVLSTRGYSCYSHKCLRCNRSDNTSVHYVRVLEPKEGMLFRASDGVLYKLYEINKPCLRCKTQNDNMSCSKIERQAFGKCFANKLHWFPVKEEKEKQEEKAKMEESQQKRHIEISVVRVEEHTVTFRISQQTHREENFTPNGREFKSSCGFFLSSQGSPEFEEYLQTLCVRGWASSEDDNKITVPLIAFAKIMQAVTEYNETNGKGYEKPWPQNGDKYYVIGSDAVIFEWHYTHSCADEARRDLGNFFRTREEAEAALERVKKALKGVDENKLLREALEEAIEMYGPWNVPGDAGGWISKARKALEAG